MNSIVVLDQFGFDDFLENEKIEATVLTNEESLSGFEINKIIEVHQSPTSVVKGQRYLAIVVEKPYRINDKSNIFKIKVCKIGTFN